MPPSPNLYELSDSTLAKTLLHLHPAKLKPVVSSLDDIDFTLHTPGQGLLVKRDHGVVFLGDLECFANHLTTLFEIDGDRNRPLQFVNLRVGVVAHVPLALAALQAGA